jgi:hypothetical protein
MKIKAILFLALLFVFSTTYSQGRHFFDVPSIYVYSPDVKNLTSVFGAGADVGYVFGTHNLMIGVRGGSTAQFVNDKISSKLTGPTWLPYARIDAGAGLFRSNGNHCSITQQNAYTAIAKFSLIYNFSSSIPSDSKLQPRIGVELTYFRIRDMFKNSEIFLDPGYNLKSKTIDFNFGMRYFLNMKYAND